MFKKNILAIFLATFLIFLAFSAKKLESQSLLPVGGPILATFYCCNGVMLTLGAPTPGNYLYTYGTPLFAHYNVWEPGPYVLGNAIGGGACLIPETFCLYPIPTVGTFTMVGTSGF